MEIIHRSPSSNEGGSGDIETLRQKLALEVKANLEKYQDQITNFNLGTVTNYKGEMFDLNNLEPIKYDSRYKEYFETYNFDEHLGKIKRKENGYIQAKLTHWITFEAYLGSDFRIGDTRNGNKFIITIAFDKNGNVENEKEVINSIMKLLETISPYETANYKTIEEGEAKKKENMKNIAKEGLPVLEAFKEIGQKYESGRGIRMEDVIKEYETVLNNK